jgi:ATP-dependent Lon protease
MIKVKVDNVFSTDNEVKGSQADAQSKRMSLPVLALRDLVVFPYMTVPLFIGRPKSVNAIDEAFNKRKKLFVVAQKDSTVDNITERDLYLTGTICRVSQVIRLADSTLKVLICGEKRGETKKIMTKSDMFFASVSLCKEEIVDSKKAEALRLVLLSNFVQFIRQDRKVPSDVVSLIETIEDYAKLCDNVSSYLPLKLTERQKLLEMASVIDRFEFLILAMEEKSELMYVEKKIKSRVKKQVEKTQKEYYLNEQLKAIYKELGDADDINQEIRELEKSVHSSCMSPEAKAKALHELKKLRGMPPSSQEGAVIRSYVDWLLNIPWIPSNQTVSMLETERILDENHYGLEKIKERITEYVAVQHRVKKMKGQIMCFVGPPGVGKTSLGKAIAKATGKSFARIALGGVDDESEIRGHRRTYIGSMPGKIVQAMKRAKTTNPVIMLDEIDKTGSDWRGDPVSALLEVLDPEQNDSFTDHYIEIPYDLSDVMFIATANSLSVPHALLDRMEIIRLSGYTETEKLQIAKQYIIPKQLEENGLTPAELLLPADVVLAIIRDYTRESGVRNLEREIAKIARKVVKKLEIDPGLNVVHVTPTDLKQFLGIPKYTFLKKGKEDMIGVVAGMAWTESGGDLLSVEALLLPGTGGIISTGKLGEVMQESVKAAYSYVKSQAATLNIDAEMFSKHDIHIHVPEGAVPKDGPSAGVTICTAIVSALTKRKVKNDLTMTGEITLVGKVLPIGGLKEKLLAARRGEMQVVFIPKDNELDLEEIPANLKKEMNIKGVSHVSEIFDIAFVDKRENHPVLLSY